MAAITKQANFRLSNNHVNIITSLSASEHVTKAAVVEHALELLEARVDAGEHIRASRSGGPTKQANFRLSVRHVDIIDRLSAREHVTKATVVERALELAQEEVANGGSIASGSHRAVHEVAPAVAMSGSAALKVSEPEETPVLTYFTNESPAPAAVARLDTPDEAVAAPATAKPAAAPEVKVEEQKSQAQPRHEIEIEAKPSTEAKEEVEAKPEKKHETTAAQESDQEEAVAESAPAKRAKKKAARMRKPAEESVRVQDPMEQAVPMDQPIGQPAQQPYPYGGYPMPAMPAPGYAPQYMSPAAAYCPAPAGVKEPEVSKAEMKAAVFEERMSGQIAALKESLEAKDARIDALLKQLDERKQDDKDARMESLISQIAENSGKPSPVVQQTPAPVPATQTSPASQQQSDPRIDMILQRLDSQKQEDPRIDQILRQMENQNQGDPRIDQILRQLESQKQEDPRIDQILRQMESQKQDDQSARLEALIRELAAKTNQPVAPAPAPAATPSRNDEILQIINALKPAQPSTDSSYQIEAARNAGREEGRREAEAEVNRRLDDLRREYERKIEAARSEGYEAGKKEINADTEKLLAEARTSGAFYERAKIANMRGLVFGEKRRYLKVHVTM